MWIFFQLNHFLRQGFDCLNNIDIFSRKMRFFNLISGLNILCIFKFLHIFISQNLNLLDKRVNLFLKFEKIVLSWFTHLNLLEFILHLSYFNISCYNFLLQKGISLSKLRKGVLNLLDLILFFINLFFCIFNIFDNSKVMIFCHMNHMVDILNFLIHINWHGGNNFFNVAGSLLIMLFHLCILIKDRLGDVLEFEKLRLYLIFLMFELLIFLFKMLNQWHKVLYFKIKTHVRIVICWFVIYRHLWKWSFTSLWDCVIALIFVVRGCHSFFLFVLWREDS